MVDQQPFNMSKRLPNNVRHMEPFSPGPGPTMSIQYGKPQHRAILAGDGQTRSIRTFELQVVSVSRRCRLHGGARTGPRIIEGLAWSRRARSKHGALFYRALAEQ